MQLLVRAQELHTIEVTSQEMVAALTTLEVATCMLGGEVHGSLATAGKVRGQTPKVAKQEEKKETGQAKQWMQYNRHFVNIVPTFGKKKGPNANS
uniref:40S ribosomal protein S30 n=1 Tax=Equus caballus TaxID=9796 RepID=A0A3Q2KXW8_HORSE